MATVKQGDTVAVSRYNSRHEIINSLGIVLSVDSISPDLQGPDGEPAISVLVVDTDNIQKLSSAFFSGGLLRLVNVVCKGHPSLETRKAIAAYEWEDIQSHLPNLLEPIEAAPENPVFQRLKPIVPAETPAAHATAVQTGQIEGPTVVSPSVSETLGTTGAPTTTAEEVPTA
jgi:hypothetical protein